MPKNARQVVQLERPACGLECKSQSKTDRPHSPHPTRTRSPSQNDRLMLLPLVCGDGPNRAISPVKERACIHDHLTGWEDAYPISNMRGSTIADILQREYCTRYSPPEVLISDNGTEFVNSAVSDPCKAWGVERQTTTVYHPQSNGKVERFHRTFKGLIERLMSKNKINCENQLRPALHAYRLSVSSATDICHFRPYMAGVRSYPRQ